ncbi:MAG: hypothetical protein A2V88_13430 [Elusimicrobia bacterium RBG_16_66_12]|nr:MAG: hypothetical protein A2V88_13430 [Elusimicrobia bacterium RBG_16_66_12]
MKRPVPLVLIALGSVLLFWNLGRPALWQDEAETALRAESILDTGLPRRTLRGVLVTTQHSLAAHEGNAEGIWTWNTWLPAYLVAASFAILGRTPFAARLPFALSGLLALWLAWRLFSDGEDDELALRRPWSAEAALAMLVLSPAFLLFCRQSRYYGLIPLGTVLVLHAWRRLLAKKPWGAWALALSLQFLLHASFAFFACACLALVLDAALRLDECPRAGRFWAAAVLTLALAAPAAWYFRIWDRLGNHAYGFAESLEFLKTSLLWLAAFAMPLALVVAVYIRRWILVLLGAVLLCGLVSEGPWSRLCAVAVWSSLLLAAAREPAPYGVMSLRRMCLLSVVATLAVLSFSAAEPYGRYLAGLLPVLAYLAARGFSGLARGSAPVVAGLVVLAAGGNLFFVGPLKAAQSLVSAEPAASVSGMMRQRLRDLPPRSDLRAFVEEIFRGPEGYIEAAAAVMKAGGGKDFFSDADDLSLIFAAGLRPLAPEEFKTREPDWLMPSPWIRLTPELDARVSALIASGRYEQVIVDAPRLLWQNNPDPLFRDFSPRRGPLPLFRRLSP